MNKPDDSEQLARMNRRQAIFRVSALLGGAALVGGAGLWAVLDRREATATDDAPAKPPGDFTADDVALLDEIAETILPATKTPGAKAAQTGMFMALMVTDCYSGAERQAFRDGMGKVDAACRQAHQVPFVQATPAQRLALLTPLDAEQKQQADAREAAAKSEAESADDAAPVAASGSSSAEDSQAAVASEPEPVHYFRMMKELALLGYFTSEIGYTQAMRYSEVPSRFDPCIPYQPGETSWAPHA